MNLYSFIIDFWSDLVNTINLFKDYLIKFI